MPAQSLLHRYAALVIFHEEGLESMASPGGCSYLHFPDGELLPQSGEETCSSCLALCFPDVWVGGELVR